MFSQGKGILKWIRAIIKKQVNSMGIIKVNSSHTKNKSLNTDFLWDTPHYTQTSPQKGMHACHPDARQTPTCTPLGYNRKMILSSPAENLSVSQGLQTHFKISELSMQNIYIYIFLQINGWFALITGTATRDLLCVARVHFHLWVKEEQGAW